MSLTDEIIAAHRKPREVLSRHFKLPMNEVLTLALALTFGLIVFCALLPSLRASSYEMGTPFVASLLPAAFGAFGLLPIILIMLGSLQAMVQRLLGGQGRSDFARRGLVWSLVVAGPWILLSGIAQVYLPSVFAWPLAAIPFVVFAWQWVHAIKLNEKLSSALTVG